MSKLKAFGISATAIFVGVVYVVALTAPTLVWVPFLVGAVILLSTIVVLEYCE